jgi:mannose-1-phosphate guanylyltransferase
MKSPLWSVVLAAGAGRRLSSLTRGTPKQFWRPAGSSSLIEETLARLAPICPDERTVIVVAESHREYVNQWSPARRRGRVVFQPEDRGTAAGVLFGLVPVLAADPNAVVLITPSDHGVENPDVFRRGIEDAVAHVQLHSGVVLFGVEPLAAQVDYGWITLASSKMSTGVQRVASFVEKPPAEAARQLLSSGAVWNSMVVVARAQELLGLCDEHLPELTAVFVRSLKVLPDARLPFLAACYPSLPAFDFSRDVLTEAHNLLAYTWSASMGWSDLGTPERLQNWLRTVPVARLRVNAAPTEASRVDAAVAAI